MYKYKYIILTFTIQKRAAFRCLILFPCCNRTVTFQSQNYLSIIGDNDGGGNDQRNMAD